jgi:thioesterase domain-containing protein
MSRLEKKTGKRLPVASLFDAPTVEKLAIWAEMEGKAITLDSLVPLKASGNKMPLYIVHGYDMNVLSFTAVAKHMDQDQPVFGLQPKGLNNTEEPFTYMEGIAAEYITEILAQNPSGPYALAGYSFGGYIAYEMAQQLQAMGKQVKLLGMFDAYAYSEKDLDPAPDKLKRKIARQVPKALFILNSLVKQPMETIGYQSYITKEKLKGLFGGGKPDKENTKEDKVFERYEYAYRHYTLKPYEGVIDLFRVQKRLYFLDDMKYLGWRPYAKKGMRVHEIPGDHKTFIQVPNNKDFAKILQNALDHAK